MGEKGKETDSNSQPSRQLSCRGHKSLDRSLIACLVFPGARIGKNWGCQDINAAEDATYEQLTKLHRCCIKSAFQVPLTQKDNTSNSSAEASAPPAQRR